MAELFPGDDVTLWCAAIDPVLDEHKYIVPGDVYKRQVRASHELLNVSPINRHYDKDNKINTEIWIDRKKITFILSNILSNACLLYTSRCV